MTRTLKQFIRPLVPNIHIRIPHVEHRTTLEVRLGQHLGLVTRGTRGYESRYVSLLRQFINPGDRVFDVGANIGFYSVLFSRWVGSTGQVLAYEPDANNVKLLRRNADLNNCENIVIREFALSDKAGETLFSRDKVTGCTGHLGTGPTYAETIFGKSREHLVEVAVTTIDQEVERWGAPHLIKLDIEGGEFDVLSGSVQLLEQQRPILVSELSSGGDEKLNGSSRAVLATKLLNSLDYSLWDIDSGESLAEGQTAWMVLGVPKEKFSETLINERLAASDVSIEKASR